MWLFSTGAIMPYTPTLPVWLKRKGVKSRQKKILRCFSRATKCREREGVCRASSDERWRRNGAGERVIVPLGPDSRDADHTLRTGREANRTLNVS